MRWVSGDAMLKPDAGAIRVKKNRHLSHTFGRVGKSSHSHNLCNEGKQKYFAEEEKERLVKQKIRKNE